ncbi:MAG: flagellar basal body-associated FliL family protein [Rhodospirillales bacterium]|nr:flagellar basal body-associated FliL family protein [Rhodospirillales bacterium]
MADEDELDDSDGGAGADGEAAGGGGKKLMMIIAIILLLVVGGLAAAYFTGLLDPVISMIVGHDPSAEGSGDGSENGEPGARAVFFDLEEILVNLNTGGRKSSFLKIRISLELEKAADVPIIESVMPRIVDNFQVYLRELRIDDLKGSAGMYRLREELLRRVSAAVAPARIKDVLFKEMLVQ